MQFNVNLLVVSGTPLILPFIFDTSDVRRLEIFNFTFIKQVNLKTLEILPFQEDFKNIHPIGKKLPYGCLLIPSLQNKQISCL